MGKYIDIKCLDEDNSFRGYVAEPSGAPVAAIVVIQEIFGVNPGIRAKCDEWAGKGCDVARSAPSLHEQTPIRD